MLERRIASYDRQNFRKRLNEFREATDDFISVPRDNWDIDNRDLRYIFNGFVYGGLISDDNINFVSYMLEGIKGKENYIKIFVSEKRNIKKVSGLKPEEYFEEKCDYLQF